MWRLGELTSKVRRKRAETRAVAPQGDRSRRGRRTTPDSDGRDKGEREGMCETGRQTSEEDMTNGNGVVGDPATGGGSEHRALTDGREDVPGFRGQRTDKVGIGVANERG